MTARSAIFGVACGLMQTGCIPYAVGQTARVVDPGETVFSQSTAIIPRGYELREDSTRTFAPRASLDTEIRHGIEPGLDIGVRIPSLSGLIVNVKRQGSADEGAFWTAYTLGGGFVNGGNHAYGEFLFHVSASEWAPRTFVPYGALRVSQVVPLNRRAVSDSPTIGAVLGAKVGDASFAILPEIGVFYDKSALGINSTRVIFVPSVTITRRRP